jgi:outer membrane protein assembly factor BamB
VEFLMRQRLTAYFIMSLLLFIATGCGKKFRLSEEAAGIPSSWPFYRGEIDSKGAGRAGFTGRLDIIWEADGKARPAGPLTIYHGSLVFPGAKTKVKVYSAETGKYSGYFKSKYGAQSGVVIHERRAYFALSPKRNQLRCLDLSSGKTVWKRPVKDAVSGTIIVDNRLLVGTSAGKLQALNLPEGDIAWTFASDGLFGAPPSYGSGRVFQPGDGGILYALDLATGDELYQAQLDGPVASAVAIGELAFVGDVDGNVYGLRPNDGSIVWQRQLEGPIWASPAVADGRVFVVHSGGELVALNANDGSVLWKYDAGEVIRSSASVAGDYVLFGAMSGKFYSLAVADGSLIASRDLGSAVVQPPVIADSRVYVAVESGNIYCFGDDYEQTGKTGQ